MKNRNVNILAILIVSIAAAFGLNGCKFKNPTEGFKVIISADAMTAPSEFRIKDAATGIAPGFTSPIPVAITGPGAGYVYSSGGSKSISIFQGGINISLRKGAVVSQQNPIRFNIEINAPGYLKLVYPVTLYDDEPITETISLISLDAPPAGSLAKTQNFDTDIDGKTTAPILISIDSASNKKQKLNIQIAQGTQMKDANGNVVSGNIEAKVLQFTPSPETYSSFPGGLNVDLVNDVNGNPLNGGTFAPSGWVNMDFSSGGKSVKTFSQPIIVNMELGEGAINPITKVEFKEGDVLETYSLSEGDGEWVKEGVATVIKNSINNKLEVPVSVSHLSMWSMGYLIQACNTPFSFKINNPSNNVIRVELDVTAFINFEFGSMEMSEYWKELRVNPGVQTIYTDFRPNGFNEYRFRLFDGANFDFTGKLCGNLIDGGNTLNPDLMKFNIFLKCANGNQVILPRNYRVYYIDDADYQRAIVPKKGSNPAHKIDPRDGTFEVSPGDKVSWMQNAVDAVLSTTTPRNTLSLAKSKLKTGSKYRFSIYYNDGIKESREDYLTEVVTDEIKNIGSLDMTILLGSCPIK